MRCIPIPGGFMCVSGRRKACSAPGCTREATKACDFPVNAPKRKSRTCDAPLCAQHATKAGDDLDWCPPHARYAKEHGEPG